MCTWLGQGTEILDSIVNEGLVEKVIFAENFWRKRGQESLCEKRAIKPETRESSKALRQE